MPVMHSRHATIFAAALLLAPVASPAQTVSVVPLRASTSALDASSDSLSERIAALRIRRAVAAARARARATDTTTSPTLMAMKLTASRAQSAYDDSIAVDSAQKAATDSIRRARGTANPGQQDVTLGLNGGTNTGAGTSQAAPYLGFVVTRANWFHYFQLNLSTSNTVEGDRGKFGAFLLNPSGDALALHTGGNRQGFLGSGWGPILRDHIGTYYNVGVAVTDWKAKFVSGADTTERSRRAAIWYLSLGAQILSKNYQFDSDTSKKFYFGIEGGATARGLTNDVLDDESLRDSTIGTKRRFFAGPEVTLFAVIKQARPFARLTWFDPKLKIGGFSNFQTFLGVDVLTSVFSDKLPETGKDAADRSKDAASK